MGEDDIYHPFPQGRQHQQVPSFYPSRPLTWEMHKQKVRQQKEGHGQQWTCLLTGVKRNDPADALARDGMTEDQRASFSEDGSGATEESRATAEKSSRENREPEQPDERRPDPSSHHAHQRS
ncbi:hypothetical protein NDU88_003673 [Pleurodeles waltl]|uniref:Uncharacterized protein n=1 Tax=Pleurodeles waltl TaxID=8319 RepID=A0AAV7TRY0_PLEWA|nr:hypothetical protein NDU88_003673 [Pleurodeles waltl]